ncbi:MAG: hypothetical protein A3G34_08295 [Candidatus Lindowbacteria bacterium RIFCSPLOWO2_12_FULL_62_27]|nr:MAG: hypothetical protein A3I06_14740 [Candidatus Lindowbacteria bacterium RIFCSPLOWO2_02_FULL_62_12]OGH58459.1 MAG: hypothetical protein A3G34_08295 [Candidatus Lindowbacteria bacterium RIFCSPLOWO2_12_FULL_62_27]
MDLMEMWQEAVRTTRVRRRRLAGLETFENTRLPYILVSEHPRLPAQSHVRQGAVEVARPKLILPEHHPQFEGFDFHEMAADENSVNTLMFVRGVRLPSLKFKNRQQQQVYDGTVEEALAQYGRDLARTEDVATGLITGNEGVWPFALLFYVSLLIVKNVPKDIERMMEDFREHFPN